MKRSKAFCILIALILILITSLAYTISNSYSHGLVQCCYTKYWTSTHTVGEKTYVCCFQGYECTPCIVVEY